MGTIELKIFIHGNDTCFQVDWEPDTGIDEVRAAQFGDPVPIDTTGLFVASGNYPDTKYVPLIEELTGLAEIAFAEHQEEYAEMQKEAAMDHKYRMENGK